MGHAKHFVRLVGVLAVVVITFLAVRAQAVPKDYGTLGRFRASAITDAKKREPRHIGSEACSDCHDKINKSWAAGKHHTPQCENCHGPGMLHVKVMSEDSVDAYPDQIKKNPKALRVTSGIQECEWCHFKTFERPSVLKSISNVKEHITKTGGTYTAKSKCTDCHDPHTTVTKK